MKKNESRSYHQNSNYVLSPPANGRGHTVLPCFGILFYHHSIIINFLFIISAVVAHIQLNLVYECFIKICMSILNLVQVQWCLTELRNVKIIMLKLHKIQKIQVKFKSDHMIFPGLCPLNLEKKENKSFVQTNVKLNVAWQPAGHIWFFMSQKFFQTCRPFELSVHLVKFI